MKDPKRLEQYQLYHAVFGTAQGQAVLADLRKFCLYEATTLVQSMTDGKIDPFFTMVQIGKREVDLFLIKRLTEPPDLPEVDTIQ